MNLRPIFAVLVGPILLVGCGEPSGSTSETQTANASAEANQSDGMANMAMPAAEQAAKGNGTVTAVNKAAGKITLNHGPIPEANWPAMTMTFDAKPQVLDGVAVGDVVDFDVIVKGGAGEVTATRKP